MKQILLKHSHSGKDSVIEVGVDEAGRGALAGPVTVAACIMPFGFQHELIKDSKLLSEPQRAEARRLVVDNALAYAVVHIPVEIIESTNILKATLTGMHQALEQVYTQKEFDFLLIDGDQFHGFNGIPFETVVGGDNTYVSIAAASILAKTERDLLMKRLSKENPGNEVYGWGSNKGYGTKQHRDAILESGASDQHRESFISHMLTTTSTLF
ncbi:ribonuclease HII [bacterium]|jgi:ribonuclease HII|nr:ribonuclease HII [bacterium]|tara:strand:- start:107 stop:742 length:636 start_codon:yes stop_codon:yes gene_type:complete